MDLKLKNNSHIALDGFERVEYIQNTGFPSINTRVAYSGNQPTIECEIEVISNTNAVSYIYHSNASNDVYYGLMCNNSGITSFTAKRLVNNTRYYNNNVTFSGKVKIVHDRNGMTINGVSVSINTSEGGGYSGSTTLKILSQQSSSGTVIIRIYSFKVYNTSNALIRDYIPAKSYEAGHIGEACLYDRVNNTFHYSASTGTFTASGDNLYTKITNAFIKDCPNVSGINLLRGAINLTNVRCDIGSVSGTFSEIQHYTTLKGFNAEEEPDNTVPATINGTFTITNWYTTSDLQALQGIISGLTILGDGTHNVETALDNNKFAIQTLDSSKPNYNPAAAIILNNNNIGVTINNSILQNGGRWFLTKVQAESINISTLFSNKTSVIDTNAIVTSDTTSSYAFSSFDELKYFTGITTLQTNCFSGCTNLQGTFIFNSNITSLGTNILNGCRAITNVFVKGNCSLTQYTFRNSGNQTGTLEFYSMTNQENYNNYMYYKKILVRQNLNITARNMPLFNGVEGMQEIRVYGNLVFNDGNASTNNVVVDSNKGYLKFFEIYGVCTSASTNPGIARHDNAFSSNAILHLGSSSIAGSVSIFRASYSHISKIYVGKGDLLQNDVDVFNTYFADTNWSTYCGNGTPGNGKVDLWWNYNGQYRTYQVQESLINCTNSNAITWPYITRGESYSTKLTPNSGLTLGTVTVEMYEATLNGTTPSTPTDITSSVYDSSTGEINIPSVTGNVIITASAS